MTETQKEEQPLTLEQKLDSLLEISLSNNEMLQALVNAVNSAMQEPQPQPQQSQQGMPYQPGYPPPANEYGNVYADGREYSSADEIHRGPRTYNSIPDVNPPHHPAAPPPGGMPPPQQQQPPPHHPNPPPPGGMPSPPQQYTDGGERVMTPEEYRDAHPE